MFGDLDFTLTDESHIDRECVDGALEAFRELYAALASGALYVSSEDCGVYALRTGR